MMKKKLIPLIVALLACLCLTGCERNGDQVEIYNKSCFTSDNVNIKVKSGYFYKKHETFVVDENTIGLTIYFSNNDEWG